MAWRLGFFRLRDFLTRSNYKTIAMPNMLNSEEAIFQLQPLPADANGTSRKMTGCNVFVRCFLWIFGSWMKKKRRSFCGNATWQMMIKTMTTTALTAMTERQNKPCVWGQRMLVSSNKHVFSKNNSCEKWERMNLNETNEPCFSNKLINSTVMWESNLRKWIFC